MHVLAEDQYNAEMEPILKQVFDLEEDYDGLIYFTDNIRSRRIFYLGMVYVDDPLLNAIIHAARSAGDCNGCYVTLINRITNQPNHCYIPLEEMYAVLMGYTMERDLGMKFWSDYAIYSAQGNWGLVTTSAQFGLLGGSHEFIKQVELAFPALSSQVYDFLQHWKEEELYAFEHAEHPEMILGIKTWIPDLLQHVYGDELAMIMLQEAQLLDLLWTNDKNF